MPSRMSCRELVGRAEEFGLLIDALDRARAGEATMVLVGGEAGVGKTRLVSTFGDEARRAGSIVLEGGCVPLADGLLPYGPVGEAFRDAATQLGRRRLRARLGPYVSVLALVAPDLVVHPPAVDPGGRAPHLVGAFRRLADPDPVVVVSEDLHWADPSTLDLLVLLTRSLGRAPIVWIGTYRPTELRPGHPLSAALAQMERLGAARIELGSLSRADVAAQIAGIVGEAPSPALVDRVFDRSEGNPLFTEELVAAGPHADRLPANLRDLLLARVHELPDSARRVLATAATAGRVVDHRLLASVTGLPEDELLTAIRIAVECHVLAAVPGSTEYTFRHALLQEAVASTLLPGERVQLHRRLAVALTRHPGVAAAKGAAASAELAHNWLAAGDLDRGVAAHVRAGLEAESVHAMAEAHRHYEQAIELWDRVPATSGVTPPLTRAEVYKHASGTACASGQTDRAVALLDEALARPGIRDDPVTAGLLHERLGRYLWVNQADEQLVVAMYERAVDRVPVEPSTERARVLAGLGQILMLLGHYRRSAAVCDEALAIATRIGARREEGHARNTLGIDRLLLGRQDDGIAHLRVALAIAHETGHVEDLHRAHTNLAAVLMNFPDLDAARAIAHEGLEVTRRHGVLATQGAYALSVLAEILFLQGRWDDAEDLLARVSVEPGFPVAAVEVNRVAGQLASARGRVDEAEGLFAVAMTEGGGRGDKGSRARMAAARAEHHIIHRRPADALGAVAEAVGDLLDTDESHMLARLAALGLGAASEPIPGWLDRVDRVARERCESGDVPPETECNLAQARAETDRIAGHHDPAAWNEISERWQALGRPYPAAWCRVRQAAQELAAGGDRHHVASLLEEARRVAVRLRADPLRQAVDDLARRSRVRIETSSTAEAGEAANTHGLSARELEVLALIADGRTNRQISEALFISVRTAGVHVSHILTKLGVPTRGAAAATARRLGLPV